MTTSTDDDTTRTSSADIAYTEVRARLRRGELGQDDRLVDKVLAAELNMSRMPAREALIRLVHEGYLVGSTRGFRLPDLTRADILEIFEIRLALEPRAAAAATQALTEADLVRLSEALERSRRATLEACVPEIMIANADFRDIWVGVVPNGRLVSVISRYYDHVNTVRVLTMHDFETQHVALKLMEAISDGFARKDSFHVFETMQTFIKTGRDRYLALNSA
ncbi:GntR family transcriptional regulator [Flavisphingomonas formosensis]|uniref:GntR family transcriptional regulator n=1 Tax=Flavisphingomonas formosensis TaxID=861534 RepID=UPI0012FB2F2B|nr:GntR family transcriptional regulator [Sphingomonas formosensis]